VPKRQQEDLVHKTEEGLLYLTEVGKERIKPWVTDIESDVYAFSSESDAQAVSAAMARLSRNSNDLRTIIASEFMGEEGKDLALLRRVVNQFGDDSVMQLYPMQMVFEGVSNLATKEIEWGRYAAYLEQSTRYLRFDKKDQKGHYSYYTPSEFDDETKKMYEKHVDEIFDIYSELYEKLYEHTMSSSKVPENERDGAWRRACHAQACDGVRSLLPAATKATVGVVGSAQAINNMLLHLLSHELPEMNTLGQKGLEAVRKVAPVFFERTDMPTRGGIVSDHRRITRDSTRELASDMLSDMDVAAQSGPYVRMLSVDGSEDELVAKILFDASNFPSETIQAVVAKLPSEEKQKVITTYVGERYNRRAKPGRAFEFPHYLFEVQCDYGAFRDIQRHRLVDGLDWQMLHTELGHVTPDIIKEIGLKEKYEHAFDLSKELYQTLQERGYEQQAQYATLFGHIMRFNMKVNARSLTHTAELRTSSQGHPAYRKVYQDIHALVAKAHPNIAAAMRFVSTDEDEALARLGAERHHQTKFGDE
jgi:thymidylate synthase ThyX